MNTEGAVLKAAREKNGYTQLELGAKLGFTSAQFISNMERGVSKMPESALKKAVKYIGKRAVVAMVEIRVDEYRKGLKALVN